MGRATLLPTPAPGSAPAAGEERLEVGEHEVALGALGVGGDGGHVRSEDDVVEAPEALGDVGLVLEDVQGGAGDGAGLQRIAQRACRRRCRARC